MCSRSGIYYFALHKFSRLLNNNRVHCVPLSSHFRSQKGTPKVINMLRGPADFALCYRQGACSSTLIGQTHVNFSVFITQRVFRTIK